MKGRIQVLKAGLATSIQDFGRVGFSEYGVPRSGAMDQKAFILANLLLGNKEHYPVLEWAMTPPKLHFSSAVRIACTGAEVVVVLNGITQKTNRQIEVPADTILDLIFVGKGVYGYIAVDGGFDVEKVMSSASMFAPVTKQTILLSGDLLNYNSKGRFFRPYAKMRYDNSYLDSSLLGVFPGPEFELLPEDGKHFLLEKEFTISGARSRMGMQLVEPLPYHMPEILTGPVLLGTVQLTPSGRLIVLMRDCQTTGGYPRVLQLDGEALNIIAQKQTGMKIGFRLL